jgi:hypothetical protein
VAIQAVLKCGLWMKPTTMCWGVRTVAVTMSSPTSLLGVCSVDPALMADTVTRRSIRLRERAVYASAQASYAAASTAGDSASGTTGTGLTSPAAG